MSQTHQWYLKSCWPAAMRNSLLLNMSDITVYLNKSEENKTYSIELLHNVFSGRNLTIHDPNGSEDWLSNYSKSIHYASVTQTNA